jgi:hypothetical protein
METQQEQEKKVSKNAYQIAWDKQRRQTDPEYKAKKNALIAKRYKERWETDPEFRQKRTQYIVERNRKIHQFYQEHKNDFKDKTE